MRKLLELADVRDPRGGGGRRKHIFREIIAIAILAKLSGAQTFNEMEDFGKSRRGWLGNFLSLPHGIPCHDTFNRAFRSINPAEFEARFRVLAAVRGHWGIENRLHHKLDVQLGEDNSRARTGNAPGNLALLRRAVVNILGRDACKRGMRRCQKLAAWNPAYLEEVLAGGN